MGEVYATVPDEWGLFARESCCLRRVPMINTHIAKISAVESRVMFVREPFGINSASFNVFNVTPLNRPGISGKLEMRVYMINGFVNLVG